MKNDKRQKTAAEFDTYEDFYDYDVYFKGGKKHRKPKIGGDIYINTTITLKQSIMGFMQPITFTKN